MPPRTGPRAGFLQGQFAAAGLGAVLSSAAQAGADVRTEVEYVGYLGNGMHLVKNICNDQTYTVSSLGNQSFLPGTKVTLVNQGAGFGQEMILGATSGQGGGSEFAVSTSVAFGFFPVVPPPPPPPPPTANAYLAIADDGTFLYAYWYNSDGTYGSRRAKVSYSGIFDSPTAYPHGAPIPTDNILAANYAPGSGDTVLLRVLDATAHSSAVVTWTIPGAFALCEPYFLAGHRLGAFFGPAFSSGQFLVGGPGNTSGSPPFQIYSGAVGQIGAFIATPVGPTAPFTDGGGLAVGPHHLWTRDDPGNDWTLDLSALSWNSPGDAPNAGFAYFGIGAVVLVGANEVSVSYKWPALVAQASPVSGPPFQALPTSWMPASAVGFKNSSDNSRLIAFPLRSPGDASPIYFYDGPISPMPTGSPTLLQPPTPGDGPFPQVLLART